MSNVPIDDAASAARRGGRRDVDRLLDLLRPVVYRWALVWTGSGDSAEDVAQAVLLRVARSIRTFEAKGSVTTWVYRITKNMLIDFDKQAEREQSRRDRLMREAARFAASRTDPLELLSAADLLSRLMRELTPQQRAALDLVELQGYSTAEAAEMLEVSPSTLRVHLHRARRAIRDAPGASEASDRDANEGGDDERP